MKEYLFKTDKEIKTCQECPMSEQLKIENCYYCNLLHDIAENNTKNSDCPLVEVPTHGDLKDANKILQWLNRICDEGQSVSVGEIIDYIEKAPIIIEDSEEKR